MKDCLPYYLPYVSNTLSQRWLILLFCVLLPISRAPERQRQTISVRGVKPPPPALYILWHHRLNKNREVGGVDSRVEAKIKRKRGRGRRRSQREAVFAAGEEVRGGVIFTRTPPAVQSAIDMNHRRTRIIIVLYTVNDTFWISLACK